MNERARVEAICQDEKERQGGVEEVAPHHRLWDYPAGVFDLFGQVCDGVAAQPDEHARQLAHKRRERAARPAAAVVEVHEGIRASRHVWRHDPEHEDYRHEGIYMPNKSQSSAHLQEDNAGAALCIQNREHTLQQRQPVPCQHLERREPHSDGGHQQHGVPALRNVTRDVERDEHLHNLGDDEAVDGDDALPAYAGQPPSAVGETALHTSRCQLRYPMAVAGAGRGDGGEFREGEDHKGVPDVGPKKGPECC